MNKTSTMNFHNKTKLTVYFNELEDVNQENKKNNNKKRLVGLSSSQD